MTKLSIWVFLGMLTLSLPAAWADDAPASAAPPGVATPAAATPAAAAAPAPITQPTLVAADKISAGDTAWGFKTNASGSFDKFSSIVVRRQRCSLTSLVEIPPPVKKPNKSHKIPPDAAPAPGAASTAPPQ